MEQVVITGLGAITPVGRDASSTWSALLSGTSGISAITSFDASRLPTRIAGQVHGFDPSAVLDTKRVRRTARCSQLAVAAAQEAVRDAGLDLAIQDSARIGVVINTAVGAMSEVEAGVRAMIDPANHASRRVGPYFAPPSSPTCPPARWPSTSGRTAP